VDYGHWMDWLRSSGVTLWLCDFVSCVMCVRLHVGQCVSVCVESFCTGVIVPLFLLLNATIHSSPTCSRKKQ
jgi:hypothetical protein